MGQFLTTITFLKNPIMKMSAFVKNNGRYGRLVFENSEIKSVWHMTLTKGARVLEHRGQCNKFYHLASRKLLETTDTPEHAFQDIAELTNEEEIRVDAIEEEIRVDDEIAAIFEEVKVNHELDEESAVGYSISACEYHMNDGCVRDFWEMTERTSS